MFLRDRAISLAKSVLSPRLRAWVVDQQRRYRLQRPRAGNVNFGSFRRLTPISPIFGLDRGRPIDRYYIEQFLDEHKHLIRGRALELGDPFYIKKFGGERVEQIDVLHVKEGNPEATIVADLTDADHIPSDLFDCIIFTQSLQMIFDVKTALETLYRIQKPGGTLLLTSHGISKIGRRLERDGWGEYWHLTTQSIRQLLDSIYPRDHVRVTSYGNVLSAMSFLHGMSADELTTNELDYRDEDFEVLIAATAQKPANPTVRTAGEDADGE